MEGFEKTKVYDLEERSWLFARNVRVFYGKLPKTVSNIEDGKQVVRSSRSIGTNYIEANECLGQKDFKMRIRICRKEAKETSYWLRLLLELNQTYKSEFESLIKEATELMMIFASILKKI